MPVSLSEDGVKVIEGSWARRFIRLFLSSWEPKDFAWELDVNPRTGTFNRLLKKPFITRVNPFDPDNLEGCPRGTLRVARNSLAKAEDYLLEASKLFKKKPRKKASRAELLSAAATPRTPRKGVLFDTSIYKCYNISTNKVD